MFVLRNIRPLRYDPAVEFSIDYRFMQYIKELLMAKPETSLSPASPALFLPSFPSSPLLAGYIVCIHIDE